MKCICIKEFGTYKIGDIVEGEIIFSVMILSGEEYNNYSVPVRFYEYFIPLFEYRDKRIDEILNDE